MTTETQGFIAPREAFDEVLSLDDVGLRRLMMQRVGALRGLWRVTLTPRVKDRRTAAQNRYYWGYIVAPFADHQRDQGAILRDGQPWTKDVCHVFLAELFLEPAELRFTDYRTGETFIATTRQSTTQLTIARFGQYIDDCIRFLEDTVGLVLLTPDQAGCEWKEDDGRTEDQC